MDRYVQRQRETRTDGMREWIRDQLHIFLMTRLNCWAALNKLDLDLRTPSSLSIPADTVLITLLGLFSSDPAGSGQRGG